MPHIIDALKMSARPTSVTFVIVVLAIGVAMAFLRRTAPLARWYFLAAFAGFWMCSTPACVDRLIAWNSGDFRPLAHASDARGARIVVVLGGGHRAARVGDYVVNETSGTTPFRVIEGARLYRLLDHPTIILSGGNTGTDPMAPSESEAMRDAIVPLGVPADHLVLERESKNTLGQAALVSRLLADRIREPIVLVTTPMHMRRALSMFRKAGLDAVPSVSAYRSDRPAPRRWLPNDATFLAMDLFVYDVAANIYYAARDLAPGRSGGVGSP